MRELWKAVRKRRGSILASVILLLFLYFVWPTPWMVQDGGHRRIHRVTGRVQFSGDEGWQYPKPTRRRTPVIEESIETPRAAFSDLVFTELKPISRRTGQRVSITALSYVVENTSEHPFHGAVGLIMYGKNDVEYWSGTTVVAVRPRAKLKGEAVVGSLGYGFHIDDLSEIDRWLFWGLRDSASDSESDD